MIKYDIFTIENIIKNNDYIVDCNINNNLKELHDNFLFFNYNKNDDKNKMNKYKYKNFKNNNIINITKIKNIDESEFEKHIFSINNFLNKISINNYENIAEKFINYYININTNNYNNLDDINNHILKNIIYNNIIFSELYVKLLCKLIQINNNFYSSLKKYYIIFETITDYLINNIKENKENIHLYNKNNDKYKSLCIFIVNCYKYNILNKDFIFKNIINLQNKIIYNIKLENNKFISEEITELFNLIILELFKNLTHIKEIDNDHLIYKNIHFLSYINIKDYKSISHKIKFKNLDLHDKYKKYIL